MATNKRPDYNRVRSILEEHGIDPNRVKEEGLDETGYDYVRTYQNGQPVFGPQFQLVTDRFPWPSKEVYEQVRDAYFGAPEKPKAKTKKEAE